MISVHLVNDHITRRSNMPSSKVRQMITRDDALSRPPAHSAPIKQRSPNSGLCLGITNHPPSTLQLIQSLRLLQKFPPLFSIHGCCPQLLIPSILASFPHFFISPPVRPVFPPSIILTVASASVY